MGPLHALTHKGPADIFIQDPLKGPFEEPLKEPCKGHTLRGGAQGHNKITFSRKSIKFDNRGLL